ncbi:hypothetical protein PF002_g31631 [Phytophthora fragariae]|uniref:Uncharacterized protein n=1 Tax=Phytophthora fragariae TaxID=53985 RepID=A0A6A3VFG2_9STRA|nr:hypothetical protein PF002_g31631 [Phytophthora fragariae]
MSTSWSTFSLAVVAALMTHMFVSDCPVTCAVVILCSAMSMSDLRDL